MPTEQAVEYILNWRSKMVHIMNPRRVVMKCGCGVDHAIKITEHQALQGSYKWCKRCKVGEYERKKLDNKLTDIEPQVLI